MNKKRKIPSSVIFSKLISRVTLPDSLRGCSCCSLNVGNISANCLVTASNVDCMVLGKLDKAANCFCTSANCRSKANSSSVFSTITSTGFVSSSSLAFSWLDSLLSLVVNLSVSSVSLASGVDSFSLSVFSVSSCSLFTLAFGISSRLGTSESTGVGASGMGSGSCSGSTTGGGVGSLGFGCSTGLDCKEV